MRLGFSFKGIHSKTYDITFRSINRPALPTLRRREVSIPFKHGIIDYKDNDYEKRFLTGEIQFIGLNYFELKNRARDIAEWLSTEEFEKLIFDDESGLYYMARVFDSVNFDQFFKTGTMQVIFECQPFKYFPFNSNEKIKWGEAHITWGQAHIQWQGPAAYSKAVTGADSIDVEYIGSQKIDYKAPEGSTFKVQAVGSFDTLIIEMNGKTLTYGEAISGQTLIIDTVELEVETDGVNKLDQITGDIDTFFLLKPGLNTVNISGTNLNCTVTIETDFMYL